MTGVPLITRLNRSLAAPIAGLVLWCAPVASQDAPLSTPEAESGVSLRGEQSVGDEALDLRPGEDADPTSAPGGDPASSAGTTRLPIPEAPEAESPPDVAADEEPAPLHLAVLTHRQQARMTAALDEFERQLATLLGRSVEFVPTTSYAAMVDAQVLGRIDGGFYSTSAFARAELQCKCLEPLAVPMAADGTRAFYAIIVAPQDAPLRGLQDLKGKVAAIARNDSVGGARMQVASLLAEGIDIEATFSGIRQTQSPEDAVLAMLAGEADVAFAWSSLEGTAASGYSRGTLRVLAEAGAIEPDAVKILWRSLPLAHGPVALSTSVPAGDRAAIAAVLIGLKDENPDLYSMLEPYYSGGYEAAGAEDYRGAAFLASEDIDKTLASLPRAADAETENPPL